MSPPFPLRGEVWLADLPGDKIRPVVVMTRETVVRYLHSVVAAPVTSTVHGIPSEVVLSADDGLLHASAANPAVSNAAPPARCKSSSRGLQNASMEMLSVWNVRRRQARADVECPHRRREPPSDSEETTAMSDVIKVGSAEDEALLLELRSAGARLDPVPDEAVLAARSAFAYRHLDADLAELTADSVVEDRRLSLVRGIGAPALLTFEAPGLTLEVEILCEGRTRRLVGQLVPAGPGRLEARHRHGSVEVDVDEVGAFTVSDVPPGPVSLGCEAAGSRRVETDWFLV